MVLDVFQIGRLDPVNSSCHTNPSVVDVCSLLKVDFVEGRRFCSHAHLRPLRPTPHAQPVGERPEHR